MVPGPNPPDLVPKQLSFLLPVIMDRAPIGKSYGDVLQQPNTQYNAVSQHANIYM